MLSGVTGMPFMIVRPFRKQLQLLVCVVKNRTIEPGTVTGCDSLVADMKFPGCLFRRRPRSEERRLACL